MLDSAGNLYGMTVEGGSFGSGTVFKLTPSPLGWIQTTLYSFTSGPDGGQPYGGVTLDAQGNVYGTAVVGGGGGACVEDGCGVVFKLTNSGGNVDAERDPQLHRRLGRLRAPAARWSSTISATSTA